MSLAEGPYCWPGGARHGGGVSLICGSCVECGKACPDTTGPVVSSVAGGRESLGADEPRKGQSSVAGHAGGPARSSGEAPVMGVERRGRLNFVDRGSINQETLGGIG